MAPDDDFRAAVRSWLKLRVGAWKAENYRLGPSALERLELWSGTVTTGLTVRFGEGASADTFERDDRPGALDLAVVLEVTTGGRAHRVPLVAIELATAVELETGELDRKTEVYSRLKQVYPFVRTVLLVRDLGARHRARLLRGARGFDLVFTEWRDGLGSFEKTLLGTSIDAHLTYVVAYWESD